MDLNDLFAPQLEKVFSIEVSVDKPVVVGQDDVHGRRQLIPISGGIVSGRLSGKVLPGGVDSQIIRPDGFTELVARYAIALDDGCSVYIDNAGVRRVAPEVAGEVANGKIVDPGYVYFVTVPKFEVYDSKYAWLERSIFLCRGIRLPDKVLLNYYEVK